MFLAIRLSSKQSHSMAGRIWPAASALGNIVLHGDVLRALRYPACSADRTP